MIFKKLKETFIDFSRISSSKYSRRKQIVNSIDKYIVIKKKSGELSKQLINSKNFNSYCTIEFLVPMLERFIELYDAPVLINQYGMFIEGDKVVIKDPEAKRKESNLTVERIVGYSDRWGMVLYPIEKVGGIEFDLFDDRIQVTQKY